MSIVVNGITTKNVVFNGKDVSLVQNQSALTIFKKNVPGIVWTQSNVTYGYFDGGARYANVIWVACSSSNKGLYYSTDGKSWTRSNVTDVSFSGGARYANGIWVAGSTAGPYYSE